MRRIRWLRSAARIVLGATVGTGLVFGGLAAFIRQPVLGTLPFPGSERARAETLRAHVEYLATTVSPRDADHPQNLDRAAAYIEDRFAVSGGTVRNRIYGDEGAKLRNVSVRYGPAGPVRVVVGAHYDSFGWLGENPGADDNASGTAGLLELARLLGTQELGAAVEVVAFSAEEPPYFASSKMGSLVHARNLVEEDVDLWGMICLEMIGFYTEKQPLPNWFFRWLYPDAGDFVVVLGRWKDRRLVRHLLRSFRSATTVPLYGFTAPNHLPGIDGSDHRSYWSSGYRAVMISDTADLRNQNYHTADDTAATLDYERMAGVVDGVFSAVVHGARIASSGKG